MSELVYPASLLALTAGVAIVALAVAICVVNASQQRETSWRMLVLSFAGLGSFAAELGLLWVTPRLEFLLDEHELRALAIRAQPLVEAIERFEADRGSAPDPLVDLVPGYLDQVPDTGWARYPTFEYSKEGGEWRLWIDTWKFFAFDTFEYAPKRRDFEEPGYTDRVGDWIYIHE